jgi:1-deoxy-D-xylulose-5-phosphate synthase
MAETNDKIVAISAAMLDGTGLGGFAKKFPGRTFDVGIAEGHAVTFAAGMATKGFRPVFAVYSTFLQRGYDQIVEDVCLQNLPVIFGIDRAGIVGADGETHHGIFDISYLNHIPNMTVLAPADACELEMMMEYAMTLDGPCSIRYPRGVVHKLDMTSPIDGSLTLKEGTDVEIWSVGTMLETALSAAEKLNGKGISTGIVNTRIVKPLDINELKKSASRTKLIVTLEDNVISGGFGQEAASALAGEDVNILNLGWPDTFVEHGTNQQLYKKFGLDADSITERICDYIEKQT